MKTCRIVLVLSAALAASFATAQRANQGVVHSQSTFEFGRIRNADGSYSSLKGAPVRVTILPLSSATVRPTLALLRGPAPFAGLTTGVKLAPAFSANVTVYQNDANLNNIAAEEGSSCLDDLTFSAAGSGKAWKVVHFGLHLDTTGRTGKFLVRWRGYETYTPGRGPGVSAFDDEFFDAGFYLQRSLFDPNESNFVAIVDLTQSPIFIVPNTTCFLAQQFREPHVVGFPPAEDGEGTFTSTWSVFTDSGPQVGLSDDIFYFDFIPDGVYDETEVDNFGETFPGMANFFLKVEVSAGNTTQLNPSSFQWIRGQAVSGNLGSLWFDDSNYLVGRRGIVLNASEAPIQLVSETFAPNPNISSLRIDVDSHMNSAGFNMRIEAFNFSTGQYVVLYDAACQTTDVRGIGFATNPAQYVDPVTGVLRAKASFYPASPAAPRSMIASVDQLQWTVTVG